MLFKNLPFARLMWLMPARVILELAAAINYLLSGHWKLAVLLSRRSHGAFLIHLA